MSRRLDRWLALATALMPTAAFAQSVHTPVKGFVDVFAQEIECAHPNACFFCINDEASTADNRLIVSIGSVLAGVEVTGLVEGRIRPFVEIDGARLTPDLLPVGAFLRSGVRWSDLPFAPSCDGTPPGVTYAIAGMPEVTESGDGDTTIDIPVAAAVSGIPFRFTVCSQLIYWGGGCNLSGSATRSFALHLPGTLDAFTLEPGDAPPIAPAGSDVVVDLLDGPGGTLTIARMDGPAPVGDPVMGPDVHWDLRSDMAEGDFAASLTLLFDPAGLPPDVSAADLRVTILDEPLGRWVQLPTTVDETAGSAAAETQQLGVMTLATPVAVPIVQTTWGALKARY